MSRRSGSAPGRLPCGAGTETVALGSHGLAPQSGKVNARLGKVIDHDEQAGTVTERVLGSRPGAAARWCRAWNAYFGRRDTGYGSGLGFQEVEVTTELGCDAAAWYVRLSGRSARTPWVILVHGRGATREECLRAVPALHRLGLTCLVISYPNDSGHHALARPLSPGRRRVGMSRLPSCTRWTPGRATSCSSDGDGRCDRAPDGVVVLAGQPGSRRDPPCPSDRLA